MERKKEREDEAEGTSYGKVKQRKLQKVLPADEIRCKRSDGRGWRCGSKRIEGSTYCEHHHSRRSKVVLSKIKTKKSLSPKLLSTAKSLKRLTAKAPKFDDEDVNDGVGGEMLSGTMEDETGSRMCHQCQRSDKEKVVHCSYCNRKRYCSPCIKTWYPLLSESDIAAVCPFCQGNCNCKACLRTHGPEREKVKWDEDMTQDFLKYLLLKLLPCLKQLNNEQREELKVEQTLQRLTKVDVGKTVISADERVYCDNCSTSIVDYHRSCPACEYQLCIACCRELRLKSRPGGAQDKQQDGKEEPESVVMAGQNPEKPAQSPSWTANSNGSISCPPTSRGGCGRCELALKTLFEPDWMAKLTMNAEMESYNAQTDHDLEHCSICNLRGSSGGDVTKKKLRLASHRKGENDNYLYCPSRRNVEKEGLAHFQKHWVRGEPVIVCNVVEGGSGLSWEPMVMWRAVRETTKNKFESDTKTVAAIDCLDWQEVDINIHQFFKGYKEGRSHKDGWPQLLKLKDWPPSTEFEERLPRHGGEFMAVLPFQQYTDPKTGFLNFAAQLPENTIKPDLGPKMYIANGLKEELLKGDSVIKLHKDMADAVYVLLHTSEVQLLEEQRQVIKKWIQKSNGRVELKPSLGVKYDVDRLHTWKSTYGGALWDIFRREDTPKLQAYLGKHWQEFCIPDHWVVESVTHPIHDQAFFLTSDHKMKLKEEYGIEAWTFEQNEGEAVLIPAGCAYQVRNLKSCIHVALEFVSPESLQECMQLTNEFRCLPQFHHANEDKLEVKKMVVYSATKVVDSLRQIRDGCN